MKRVLTLLALSVLLFYSCDAGTSLSSEAGIVSIDIDGLEATASIDSNAHTVTVTVPPMDITGLTVETAVSSGAELMESPALVDGETVTYVVEAEDGTKTEWSVTLHVQPGVSFTLAGEDYVFLYGVTADDTAAADKVGNGTPNIGTCEGDNAIFAANKIVNLSDPGAYAYSYLYVYFSKTDSSNNPISTGKEYDMTDFTGMVCATIDEKDFKCFYDEEGDKLTMQLLSYSEEIGEYCRGGFSCDGTFGTSRDDAVPASLTNGYFKVLRSEIGLDL